ncbi:hypothetical protein C7974DRAFT_317386 [Boeremia exigua]|uniref:uncharacterized protein n=1 Tax=Boeremia exigua TaxID=749465 RepID=UPI001E8D4F09|nr:uncharacterized protein C7974DRAFT_317386 [Boeremia exigua]KAH6619003.1 hypothetical protein C7974DRAFT_317386 [Boeremia exigua]
MGTQCALGGVVPAPTITPAPIVGRQDPNAIELAKVLLTALPASLRQLAATNIPAVSSILWREFLDDNKPDWFTALPSSIQSYLIVQYGPSTAWPTSTPTPSSTLASTTADATATETAASAAASPDSPPETNSGLSMGAKIGIGIGVPLGVLALLAVLIPCCIASRKKKPKKSSGYEPPPSPGFMPQGAFQEKPTSYQEHRTPLNRAQSWDHDDEPWLQPAADGRPTHPASNLPANNTAIVGPPLVHTHSSSRGRGKRTSHNSLHSVAELTEPDDTHALRSTRRSSLPPPADTHPIPPSTSIRRKPLAPQPAPLPPSPRAHGHFSLLRPAVLSQDHSGSSSSGLPLSEDSRRSSGTAPTESDPSSPATPGYAAPYALGERWSNPFSNEHYVDVDEGRGYGDGGLRSVYADGERERGAGYPDVPVKSERRASQGEWRASEGEWPLGEWPLQMQPGHGGHAQARREQWDRVYA